MAFPGTPAATRGNPGLSSDGSVRRFPARAGGKLLIALGRGEGCAVLFPRGVLPLAEQFVPAGEGPQVRVVPVPEDVGELGLTRFLIRPLHKQDRCRVGPVWVVAARGGVR